jgi:nucleoside-diphosphate-sugar epimerase
VTADAEPASEPAAPGRVLVTGASGFVGRHLMMMLQERGIDARAAVRSPDSSTDGHSVVVGEIGTDTDWSKALDGIDAVIHLAGRAHVLKETVADPRSEFMRVNAEGTARLASACVAGGVRRLIYVSSIGVLGNTSGPQPFTANSPPQPHNAYAESKLAGETSAHSIGEGKLEVVVVRPPLVYGPHVRANFLRLLRWVESGWPLPLGAVRNRRSLVNVWVVSDLLTRLLTHPNATRRRWLVSDDEDLSTPELIRRIGAAMGRRARLLPVPVTGIELAARVAGMQSQVTQLCGSLALDVSHTKDELGWKPIVSTDEALSRTVRWYLSSGR